MICFFTNSYSSSTLLCCRFSYSFIPSVTDSASPNSSQKVVWRESYLPPLFWRRPCSSRMLPLHSGTPTPRPRKPGKLWLWRTAVWVESWRKRTDTQRARERDRERPMNQQRIFKSQHQQQSSLSLLAATWSALWNACDFYCTAVRWQQHNNNNNRADQPTDRPVDWA